MGTDASWALERGEVVLRIAELESTRKDDVDERRNLHRRMDDLSTTVQKEISEVKVMLAQIDTKLTERSGFLKVALGLLGGGAGGAGIGAAVAKWWNP